MSPILGRCGALVATIAAAAVTVTTFAPAAVAATDPRPVDQGAGWLTSQLTSGLVHNSQYNFDDYGLSADVAIALNAVGGHAATVNQISNAVAQHVESYITGTDFGYPGDEYAGATAKTLVLAEEAGADPRSYGPNKVDLVTRLESMVSSSGPTTGRLEDKVDPKDSSGADYANTLGQALAARGLTLAGSGKAASVRRFLLEQQCTPGWFRLEFSAKTKKDQSCAGSSASTPDPDATSYSVIMLQPLAARHPAVAAAVDRAGRWLLTQQMADGAFGGSAPTTAVNANSTGLAGWALRLLGHRAAARRAAVWLRAHQAHDAGTCTTKLATQTGAVAYDSSALAKGRRKGITADTQDQWRRTSAQSLPGLLRAPSASRALALGGPVGFVRARSAMTLHVRGLAPGDTGCLTGRGVKVARTPLSGHFDRTVTAPRGTAWRTYAVRDSAGHRAIHKVAVLGRTTFTVRLGTARVHRRHVETATVRGLFAHEPVRILNRGTLVTRGHADANGVFRTRFHVGRRLGPATVRALGRFAAIRHGSAGYRVVR